MTLRRLVGWGFIALIFAEGIIAFFANPIVSFIYFAIVLSYTAFHFVKYCAECTNVYCPLNSKSVDYILGNKNKKVEAGFSDIDAAKAGWPYVPTLLFPLYFIWIWNPLAVFGLLVYAVLLVVLYTSTSCKFCSNNCPNNRNKEYWEWKRSGSRH